MSQNGGEPSTVGDAGGLLDDRAKAAYRRRLVEIEEDIEQAQAMRDRERAAQARAQAFARPATSEPVRSEHRDRAGFEEQERPTRFTG